MPYIPEKEMHFISSYLVKLYYNSKYINLIQSTPYSNATAAEEVKLIDNRLIGHLNSLLGMSWIKELELQEGDARKPIHTRPRTHTYACVYNDMHFRHDLTDKQQLDTDKSQSFNYSLLYIPMSYDIWQSYISFTQQ